MYHQFHTVPRSLHASPPLDAPPLQERVTDNLWVMSLRNNWCKYVQVGHLFSGLMCKIEQKGYDPEMQMMVRVVHQRARLSVHVVV